MFQNTYEAVGAWGALSAAVLLTVGAGIAAVILMLRSSLEKHNKEQPCWIDEDEDEHYNHKWTTWAPRTVGNKLIETRRCLRCGATQTRKCIGA